MTVAHRHGILASTRGRGRIAALRRRRRHGDLTHASIESRRQGRTEDADATDRAALRAQPHDRAAARGRRRSSRSRGELGIGAVEIRNDLAGNAILDGTPPSRIRRLAEDAGRARSCRSTRCSGSTTGARRGRPRRWRWPTMPQACGARGAGAGARQRRQPAGPAAARRLEGLRADPRAARGLTGLVEPLGFETCSLRRKSEAAEAIAAVGGQGVFRLVHDTFHHHLAGEAAIFPALTGLVHISGVDDPDLGVADMRDAHRVLVDRRATASGNIAQIRALFAGGYDGVPLLRALRAPRCRSSPTRRRRSGGAWTIVAARRWRSAAG